MRRDLGGGPEEEEQDHRGGEYKKGVGNERAGRRGEEEAKCKDRREEHMAASPLCVLTVSSWQFLNALCTLFHLFDHLRNRCH